MFATHFGRPLPCWADEGTATSVEVEVERNKLAKYLPGVAVEKKDQNATLEQEADHAAMKALYPDPAVAPVVNPGTTKADPHSFEMEKLFLMKQYPQSFMALFAKGYSVTHYLLEQGGKRRFVEFLGDGMQEDHWTEAARQHYGFASLPQMEAKWQKWVDRGEPDLETAPRLAGRRFRKTRRSVDFSPREPMGGRGSCRAGTRVPTPRLGGSLALPADERPQSSS